MSENQDESELDRILRQNIGEPFAYLDGNDRDTNDFSEFTLIGESQDGGLLIEWSDGEIESLPVEEWQDSIGYEFVHLSEL